MRPVPILMYHSVGVTLSAAYSRWVVSVDRFARHMALLAERGYSPMSVSAFTARRSEAGVPPRPVVITFDDGLRDFIIGAFPVLRRHGFSATLFVATGYVGETARWLGPVGEGVRPMLGWAEIDKVAAGGIEIGAHSHTHPQLDILAPTAAREEIRTSKAILEDRLGCAVIRSPIRTVMPAGRRGHSCARRASPRRAVCGTRSVRRTNRFSLSRIIVTDDMEDDAFTALLRGEGLVVAPPVDRILSTGWRFVRRLRGARGASPFSHACVLLGERPCAFAS